MNQTQDDLEQLVEVDIGIGENDQTGDRDALLVAC